MAGVIDHRNFRHRPPAVNEPGQARGDHASSRTDPDDVERLTGI
jgi:hypothetical protein